MDRGQGLRLNQDADLPDAKEHSDRHSGLVAFSRKKYQTLFFKIFSPDWVDYQPYKMLAKLPCEVSLSLTFTNWLSLIKSEKFDFIKFV